MKKIIAIAFSISAVSFTAVAASNTENVVITATSQEAKEVAITDLPQAVKTVLASEDFKGFKAQKAVAHEGDVVVYEITGALEDGTAKTVKIDANGKVVS